MSERLTLPVLPLRDFVLFPGVTAPINAGKPATLRAIETALAAGGLDIDTLCSKSGLPAAQCMAAVTELEIAGSIECAMSGIIRRR